MSYNITSEQKTIPGLVQEIKVVKKTSRLGEVYDQKEIVSSTVNEEVTITDAGITGKAWVLIHDGSKVIVKGEFSEAKSKETVECFDDEAAMEARITELGLY